MRNNKYGYLILAIAFVLVSVIAFVLPTEKNAVFWLSYCFTILAFGIQIFVWKNALGKIETLMSKFLGFPIIHISFVYLIIQIVSFGVFVATSAIVPIWVAIIVSAMILCIALICMITAEVGKEEITRIEQKVQKKVFTLKSLQVDVEMLASSEKDDTIKSALIKLAEKIKYSDPMSSEKLEPLEQDISEKISQLKTSDKSIERIDEIIRLITERNAKCKILK